MKTRVIHIGLPELDEDELVAIGELAQETVINHVFTHLAKSEVKDIEAVARITRDETLNLELELYIEVPIFVRVDVDALVEEALRRAYQKVEEKLRSLAHGEKDERETQV
ncbi:DUF3194 domain-containing protein [Thermococcus sp.]